MKQEIKITSPTHVEEIGVDVEPRLLPEDVEVGAEGHRIFLEREQNWMRREENGYKIPSTLALATQKGELGTSQCLFIDPGIQFLQHLKLQRRVSMDVTLFPTVDNFKALQRS